MRFLLLALALLALAGCQKQPEQPAANQASPTTAEAGPHKGVDRSHKGEALPDVIINGLDGGKISLREVGEGPTLVNVWATWCAPCVKELPTLDRLAQKRYFDWEYGVIAVSQDSAPAASVAAFLHNLKVKDLVVYQDPSMSLSGSLGPDAVLPTTILYDANHREVWRYVGDLDWTSPEAARLLAEAKPAGKG